VVFSKEIRIIGGEDSSIENFPYLASLRRISNNEHVCGGTIISNQHILTAAHCFQNAYLNETNMQIITGSTYLSRKAASTFFAEKVIIHPEYQKSINIRSYFNDIAIVKVCYIIQNKRNKIKVSSNVEIKIFYNDNDLLYESYFYKNI
jgi:secreted trypsin-like serine protease